MAEGWLAGLPPVLGCLFCHTEGAVSVEPGRAPVSRGNGVAVIKCSYCGAVAELDAGPESSNSWRIRYRKVNPAERYYYVARHFGGGNWLDGDEALRVSTYGFVQRQRVRQTSDGDLSWLAPLSLDPLPPFIVRGETVYLELRAVTLQRLAPRTWIFRAGQDELLDSGKLFVTDRKLHLLGQRRDWSVSWADVLDTAYDDAAWRATLGGEDQTRELSAQSASNEIDPQLITAIFDLLRAR